MTDNDNSTGLASEAPDGKCPECGEVFMISHVIRTEGSAILSEHCGKIWRTTVPKNDAELIMKLSETIKIANKLVGLKEAK